ncbi:fungal-specific transcription factor domain-containing protein [Phyllosticta paracitricarpa]|uniref:Fungal-specific transcription factor domain-containing protein n=1 Tax=Phyllosticta paracitricarpa TaxID=2016321 RepID=A0ABR1N4W0_9PEZI
MAAVEPPAPSSPSPSPSPSPSANPVQPPPEKRRKITRACDNCKSKKKRCTGTQPCPSCEKAAKPCTYLASYTRGRFNTPPSSRGLDALVLAAESHNHLSDRRRRGSSSTCPDPMPVPVSRRNASFSADYPPSVLPALPPLHHQGPRLSPLHPLAPADDSKRPSVQLPARPTSRRPSPETDRRHLGPKSSGAWLRRAMRKLNQARPPSDGSLGPRSGTSSEATVFTFGDKPPVTTSGFEAPLPPPALHAEYLVGRYFEFAMPTYRFLHRPSITSWLWELSHDKVVVAPAKRAVLYMIFAYAMLYETSRIKDQEADSRRKSEADFREAQVLLAHETGPATLESVQARFIQCHYLLSTGRSNQAWYTFGTTVQLSMALGLHRKRYSAEKASLVVRETKRRLFWAIYTLDRYLAIVSDRPTMLQDDDISQEFPLAINDDDLTDTHAVQPSRDDCLEDGPISHCQLARMVGRIAKEQHSMHTKTDSERRANSMQHHKALDEWRARLPPLLSGCIKPSSLILIFRRQCTVLKLAHAHAVMLVNRPFLLSSRTDHVVQGFADDCLAAARTVLELVLAFFAEGQPVSSFWFTQHIVFNALAVIYVHLLHARHRHHHTLHKQLSPPPPHAPDTATSTSLLSLADATTQHLATITEPHAPSSRYALILDELRQDLTSALSSPSLANEPNGRYSHPPPPPPADVKPSKPAGLPNGASTLLLSPPDEPPVASAASSLSSANAGTPNGRIGDVEHGDGRVSPYSSAAPNGVHDLEAAVEGWDRDVEIGSPLFWLQLDALPMGFTAGVGVG